MAQSSAGSSGQCDVSGYGDPRRGKLRQYLRVKYFSDVDVVRSLPMYINVQRYLLFISELYRKQVDTNTSKLIIPVISISISYA